MFNFSRSQRKDITIARELNLLWNEICVVSERMRECNSDLVEDLYKSFEGDGQFKNFKVAVLASAYTKLKEEKDLKGYLKELDAIRDKMAEKAHSVLDRYTNADNPWDAIKKELGEEKYDETLEAFYHDHFLTAQRFIIGAWLAKKNGDSLYMYKGPE
ncbi:MAG TPA: hypothetical protein VFE94_04060 [Candidatus Paceibacterota bacterium]|nr:hypothetical protein [Candidatus Paceibacterota bacterium]